VYSLDQALRLEHEDRLTNYAGALLLRVYPWRGRRGFLAQVCHGGTATGSGPWVIPS
jgi:hypothetical protein